MNAISSVRLGQIVECTWVSDDNQFLRINTNPNCQRNKALCCNFLMWQDNTIKLRIFASYTVIMKSV